MDRYSARSGEVPLSLTLTFFTKMSRRKLASLSTFWPELSGGPAPPTLDHPAPGTLKPAVSQPLRQNTLFSQMDLFTVIAIAIVVVLIITLVVMSGWLR